jgi:hypothetical protein
MPNYSQSTPLGYRGYKLNTGKQARQARAFRALRNVAPPGALDCTVYPESTGQNSSSIITVNGVRVLISYETAVAFRHRDGSHVATERGEFSRTTDRAVSDFVPGDCVRLAIGEFQDSLRLALKK